MHKVERIYSNSLKMKSEDGSQMSEVRCQKSDVRSRFCLLFSDFCFLFVWRSAYDDCEVRLLSGLLTSLDRLRV